MGNNLLFQRALNGTVLITLGQVLSYGLSFIRNVLLARALTKSDFGLAAVLGMTVSLIEVAGKMSFGQQLIQSLDGDSRVYQSTSHAFQFALALSAAFLLLALSYPAAIAFKVPELTWAFALMSIILLARGLENLDYYREQRELRYLPAVLYEVVPQIIVTAATWPLILWLKDFRAILWIMIIKAVTGVIISHLTANHGYRWAWDKRYIKSMWVFGWPLILNGLLMFGSQQADQMVVGSFLSLSDLASYALVLSLVSIPWFIFGQLSSSLMLPILARVQNDRESFQRHYRQCAQFAAVASVVLTSPLIIGGEQFVRLFFGSKYAGTGTVIAVLGAASCIRFMRSVPSISAMARADTTNQLYSNLWRGLSLPMAILAALLGGDLVVMAFCAIAAEFIAAGVSFYRLKKTHGVRFAEAKGAILYVFFFVCGGIAAALLGTDKLGLVGACLCVSFYLGISLTLGILIFPSVWHALREAGRHWAKVKARTEMEVVRN